MELTPVEGRVLGSLVEKQRTTPQAYPLTDNALVAACNQTTNRDPVVVYDTGTVRVAVRHLRELGLVRTVHRSGERSDKHEHRLAATLDLSPAQEALLAVLLLRGAQTPGELRSRSERMEPFGSLDEVLDVLEALADRPEPLVARLERLPGHKEARYRDLLVEAGPGVAPESVRPDEPEAERPVDRTVVPAAGLTDRVAALEREVARLGDLVAGLVAGSAGSTAGQPPD